MDELFLRGGRTFGVSLAGEIGSPPGCGDSKAETMHDGQSAEEVTTTSHGLDLVV